MTTEDPQPRLLAEWLAAPAGTPAPEGLDPEVAAAVYALRPDRSPAPRVAMSDIFAAVASGPFARAEGTGTETTTPAGGFPGVGARRTAGIEERAPRKRASRWWMTPAVGLSLAAAAALLVVIPTSERYVSPDAGTLAEEGDRAEQAAPPAAAPPPLAASAPMMPKEGWIPELMSGSGGVAQDGNAERRKEEEQSPTPAAAPVAVRAPRADAAGSAYAGGADAAGAEPKEVGLSTISPPTPALEAPASSREAVAEKKSARDEESDENVVQTATKAKAAQSPAKSSSSRSSDAATSPASVPASSEPTAGAMSRGRGKDSVANNRNTAIPDDYSASWYANLNDIAPAYVAAAVAGTNEEAISAWTALIAHPDPRVGQDAAFRAANLTRGNPGRALGLVARGLARSMANTPFRSNLLLLKGDLLLAQRNEAAAESAWSEARSLNDDR